MKFIQCIHCPDSTGIIAEITQEIGKLSGNIISLNEFVSEDKQFFLRVVWETPQVLSKEETKLKFAHFCDRFRAEMSLVLASDKLNVGIFVSKFDHCLQEILLRYALDELPINIPLIISNHLDLKPVADRHNIPFHVFSITSENKKSQEKAKIQLLKDHKIDRLVLARYMQILSPQLVDAFPNKIINIHHSFLPAFSGGQPYKQAYSRGVKLIGATSHFVTEDLDAGPIIAQEVTTVSHKDMVNNLEQKGRLVERQVCVKALSLVAEHKVFVTGNKTIVFE